MRHVHKSVAIADRSSVGEARRTAVAVAQSLGFDEEQRHNIGIVATEAATNIVIHAKTGELLICPSGDDSTSWIDLLAIDAGPGIPDVARAMEDGYSTIGTSGQGLGAIGRLSDHSSLQSTPRNGTVYWSRFEHKKSPSILPLGAVSMPIKGETTCGDGYLVALGEFRSLYMVVDGLGHGVGASEASDEAVAVVQSYASEPASEILARTHDALKKTRGAAMSIAIVDHARKVLTYAGIGNIGAVITNGTVSRTLISQNGTLGAVMPRAPQEYTYPVESNSLLMMFSDGLASKAGISNYTGIQGRHPAVIAGLLYRDFSRRRDDATVMVARIGESANGL